MEGDKNIRIEVMNKEGSLSDAFRRLMEVLGALFNKRPEEVTLGDLGREGVVLVGGVVRRKQGKEGKDRDVK